MNTLLWTLRVLAALVYGALRLPNARFIAVGIRMSPARSNACSVLLPHRRWDRA